MFGVNWTGCEPAASGAAGVTNGRAARPARRCRHTMVAAALIAGLVTVDGCGGGGGGSTAPATSGSTSWVHHWNQISSGDP